MEQLHLPREGHREASAQPGPWLLRPLCFDSLFIFSKHLCALERPALSSALGYHVFITGPQLLPLPAPQDPDLRPPPLFFLIFRGTRFALWR